MTTPPATILPPTALARTWVRYLLGFGVGVPVALGPLLGKVKVPGFSSLLDLYPVQMQQHLIPLSGFSLVIVAVAVQFYSAGAPSVAQRQRRFRALLAGMLVAFVLLVILYQTSVLTVPIENGAMSAAVIIGWSPRVAYPACPCAAQESDFNCMKDLTFTPGALDPCWKHLRLFELALMIPYLFLQGGLGALVGFLLPGPAAPAAARPKPRPGARAKASSSTARPSSPGAKPAASRGRGARPKPGRGGGGTPLPPEGQA
jgi:hypothetical protein